MSKFEITPDTKVDALLKRACIRNFFQGKTVREMWRMFPMRARYRLPNGTNDPRKGLYKLSYRDRLGRRAAGQVHALGIVASHFRVYNNSGIKRPMATICRSLTKQLAPRPEHQRYWSYLDRDA